jgi:photosystem II stability/assembly factor-like uncharacterized protein
VLVGLGAILAVWAAVGGIGSSQHTVVGPSSAGASRGSLGARRAPILEVGSGGGVTWAINGTGMWLSANGGRTWRASLPPHVAAMGDAIARVEQVQFADPRHGWLVAVDVHGNGQPGRHAELDWTSDGGRTWHSTTPEGCCGHVSFVTPSRGFSLGSSELISTTDGGARWKQVSRSPFSYGVPTFVDARHGVAVAGKGDFYRTTDGGRRWTPTSLPGRLRDAEDQSVLPAVASFGRRLVVPAERSLPNRGSGTFRLVVYVSGDGGSSWAARPAPLGWVPVVGSEDAQRFSAASPSVWFAAGWRKLIMTRDAGRTWHLVRVDLPARWTIVALDFTSPRIGWAIFQGLGAAAVRRSVLMRTIDGGRNWAPAGPRKRKA